jgi:hypothetical protein
MRQPDRSAQAASLYQMTPAIPLLCRAPVCLDLTDRGASVGNNRPGYWCFSETQLSALQNCFLRRLSA